jgi:hypothetical protein
MPMTRCKNRQPINLCAGGRKRARLLAMYMEHHKKKGNRGLLDDAGKVIDFIQDLAFKIEILTTKIEEALTVLKEQHGGD